MAVRGSGFPAFESCLFTENHAGDNGGAFAFMDDARPYVFDTDIDANSAGSLGGGLYGV